ncbi:MAG TPA: hypothetical protein VF461_20840 [Gemmatimonadaceae bacterium]
MLASSTASRPHMRRSAFVRITRYVAGSTLAALACSDASAPTQKPPESSAPPVPAVVSIAHTATVGDSIDATLVDGLVITVRDSKGVAVPSASVRVEWSSTTIGPVSFAPSGSAAFAPTMLALTDAQGVARVSARLGRTAGSGFIRVTETSKEIKDSLSFIVQKGAVFRSTLAARDAAMLVGARTTVTGTVYDRGDNPIPVTLSATDTTCTLASDGTVAGVAPGVCRIAVGPPVNSTIRIAIVAASMMLTSEQYGLGLVRLDGTEHTLLPNSYQMYNCVWLSSGTELICPTGGFGQSKLYRVGLDGSTQLIPITGVDDIGLVRVSHDGNWLVFTGYPAPKSNNGNTTLYRARIDGSQLQVLASYCCSAIMPYFDISPDGSVVYYSSYSTIRLDVASGNAQPVVVGRERIARFSPDGTTIAYQDGLEIWLSNADGSNQRVLFTPSVANVGPYFQALEWSPDGKWLLTIGYGDKPFLIAADGSATLNINQTSIRNYKP